MRRLRRAGHRAATGACHQSPSRHKPVGADHSAVFTRARGRHARRLRATGPPHRRRYTGRACAVRAYTSCFGRSLLVVWGYHRPRPSAAHREPAAELTSSVVASWSSIADDPPAPMQPGSPSTCGTNRTALLSAFGFCLAATFRDQIIGAQPHLQVDHQRVGRGPGRPPTRASATIGRAAVPSLQNPLTQRLFLAGRGRAAAPGRNSRTTCCAPPNPWLKPGRCR